MFQRFAGLGVSDPLLGGIFEIPDHGRSFVEESLLRRFICHRFVFASLGFEVAVFEGVVAAEFFDDVGAFDEGFELFDVVGEVDFAGDDGVEPAFDDFPYA